MTHTNFNYFILIALLLLGSIFCLSNCMPGQSSSTFLNSQKIKGIHVFGKIDSTNLTPLTHCNYNWVTLVDWGSQEDYDSKKLNYSKRSLEAKQRIDSLWTHQIELAHQAGFKVLFKPHLWLYNNRKSKWRSDIFPANEENWQSWKEEYREFILDYAKIAEKSGVELYCVGTELTRLTLEKSDYWVDLIKDVKKVYSGKLTYAANWYEEFEKITFWDQLDYIGIQAYFPLVKNEHPSVEEISKGWDQHLSGIEAVHRKFNKPILFTELGYKSTADTAIEPWAWLEHDDENRHTLSLETQANCYEAFFKTIWQREWLAGVQIWQCRIDYTPKKENLGKDFHPRGKPAEAIITNGFK